MDAPELTDLISSPQVWERLDRVEKRLIEASHSDDPFLTEIAQHGLLAGGKRFRPLLAQLAAEFGPNLDHRAIDAGASVELIHLGSLYHDDVIDEAITRRGAASVNSNWSNTIAILAGDFLMARASEVAASTLGQEAVRLLAHTYAELVEGQTLELQVDHNLNHGPAEYYRIIGGKTASLIRTSARLGAMASDAPPEVIEAVSTWAWELGHGLPDHRRCAGPGRHRRVSGKAGRVGYRRRQVHACRSCSLWKDRRARGFPNCSRFRPPIQKTL